MLRIAMIAAAALLIAAPSTADAQVIIGNPYGYGYSNYYSPYGAYYGGYYGSPYGAYNEWGYQNPYVYRGYRPYYGYPGYVVPSLPSGTGSAFSGSRNSGNYWYWLQQQANQGRIPQSTVNRMMYGNR